MLLYLDESILKYVVEESWQPMFMGKLTPMNIACEELCHERFCSKRSEKLFLTTEVYLRCSDIVVYGS
jgi:hypothetical protein